MRRQQSRIRVNQPGGFTLVELLVGSALSVLVVSSLAAIALISELRMGKEAEVNQSLRDHWSRAISFITNEARQAYWIRTELSGAYPCGGETPDSLLVLEGPPALDSSQPGTARASWQIIYGVRANGTDSTEWRGFNRLVRCGPPFLTSARGDDPTRRQQELQEGATAGNLNLDAPYGETVIADQLAETRPFQPKLFDTNARRDRDALLQLFLSRRGGASYPPALYKNTQNTNFQTQIRASRNPGFNHPGLENPPNTRCLTTEVNGNQQPPAECLSTTTDNFDRTLQFKEYLLPTGNLNVNRCEPTNSCVGPMATNYTDVIYLMGNSSDFTMRSAASGPNAAAPCSRSSCYVSNGSQSVQIFDGDVLVFYDRVLRL